MRSWVVIPAMGVVCGGAAIALDAPPTVALAGAALAAVVRVLAGDAPAALVGAVLAPLLAVASWAAIGGELPHAVVAVAAAAWTITELARGPAAEPVPPEPDLIDDPDPAFPFSPLVAVAPAVVAAVLDPRFVGLVAITGARLMTLRWARPRWAVGVPVAGALAIILALIAATSWPALGLAWFGGPARAVTPAVLAARTADALGPLTAVAALAGLASLVRSRYAELALAASIAGAALVDLRAGAPGVATVGLAAVLAGLAIHRLAALIRIPSGQAITGAALGALLVLPPVWTAIERRDVPQTPPAAHTARASR